MKVRTHTSAYRRSCVVTLDNLKLRLIVWKGGISATTSAVLCSTQVWTEILPIELTGRDRYFIFGESSYQNLFNSMPDKGMLKLKAMAMAQRLPKFHFNRSMSIQQYIDLMASMKQEVANWSRAIKGGL